MRVFRSAIVLLALLAARRLTAQGPVVVKLNDTVSFRLGLQVQSWAEWTQDPNSEGYSQNFLVRRIRFILLANVAPGVSVFYQTDSPRIGNAGTNGAKDASSKFITQDAFLEWRLIGEKLMLDGGLFYVPQARNVLTSTSATLAVEGGTFVQQQNAATVSNTGRDYGVGLKGYLADDRLEYRAGVFSGQRQATAAQPPPLGSAAGARNAFRAAARVQYDFFDTEKGYTYVGTSRGTKRILAVGGWGDFQGDYKGYGADAVADIPIGKDAVTSEVDYLRFDGGRQFGIANPLLPKQSSLLAQAGYYFDAVALQPFVRYERLDFDDDARKAGNQEKFGGGLNYYVYGQNLKISALYERIVPRVKPATARVKDTNHLLIAFQALYF
jgi:hypothetical protein